MKKIFIIMFTAVVFFMTAACGNVKYNALIYDNAQSEMKKEFLDYLRQFAQAGTKLYFRTDHAEYFEWTTDVINANENWEITGETILPIEVVSQFQRILPEFSTLVARAI